MRCHHEAQLHDDNCFATLTYDDDHLPEFGSLSTQSSDPKIHPWQKPEDRQHLQKFTKRLRKHVGHKIKIFGCGEYGDTTDRAHYHLCIFGYDFNDKIEYKRDEENILYLSETLQRLWGMGNTSVGSLTFNSAAYCASYILKKTLGKGCPRYVRTDEETGELIPLVQPFPVFSLNPAIAKEWLTGKVGPGFTGNHTDVYNKDYTIINGRKYRPAKYYDKLYDTINYDHMEHIKGQRVTNAEPQTEREQRARAAITRARINRKTQV